MANTKVPSELIADNSVGITQLNVSDGTNGQVLTTNGSGTLSFSTISGYTDSDVETYLNTSAIYTDATNDRLGIGTSSPSGNLHVDGGEVFFTSTGNSKLQIKAGNTSSSFIEFGDSDDGNVGRLLYSHSDNSMQFTVNAAERMRIDSSGNVGIGATSLLSSGGADATTFTVKATQYPQIFMIASNAAANSTTYRQIVRHTREYQIQAMNDAGSGEQTAYEINRASGSSSIDSQKWFVGTSEAMRIDSSGNLRVGLSNSTPANNTEAGFLAGSASGYASCFIQIPNNAVNGYGILGFYAGSTLLGNITKTGSNSCAYNTSSDYRLKENVNYDFNALDRVAQLKPARFNFIADETDTTVDGFLAHEVQDIVPEAIHGVKDEVDEDGNAVYQGIDQSKLVPLLTKAIQEQQVLIEQL